MKPAFTLLISLLLFLRFQAWGQVDSTLFRRIPTDTSKRLLNMDAVYNRPFLGVGKLPVSVGGYMEVNWQHLGTDGISEGHQFQFRRMTLFVASTINRRLKFLSEIEFEDGTKEIAIEFAALDVTLHPLVNLRGGIIMNPIGAFNQNHDGPKWEFTDRPLPATQMLPATWSNAGFGLYGKQYAGPWMVGYEAYVSNGFNSRIIQNPEGKTFLPAAKTAPDRFEENESGLPSFTGKIAARHARVAEVGLSWMGGVYNKFQDDGLRLDQKRRCDVMAIDFNTTLPFTQTYITGEWAWVFTDVPSTYSAQFGRRQQGGFVDVVQPILKRPMLGWENATLNLACRLEYVDWNVGTFRETSGSLGDELRSMMAGLSFRPTAQTVFRLNYRYMRQWDLLHNPPARTGGFSFGISSYF